MPECVTRGPFPFFQGGLGVDKMKGKDDNKMVRF